ncbi:MAG: methylmalonyl-CoA mutase [Deltaproteobacteria bacterium]|nr:methylmalonyl-CoA mutase [Deltaproteobacteria bacterium]MBW2346725.1 methylmalonyl-CoA mutase [Deltaproteobacteria bacterium]
MDNLEKIKREKERWAQSLLKKRPARATTTDWGEPIEVLYGPEALEDSDYLSEVGFPGQYPFVRGIHPNMYLGRPWTMRQYAGFGTAEETNRRYRYLLEQGQTGLSVAFDLPTQIGYDSDHPMSEGEVGKVGVPVDSLQDMEVIFRDIPLDKLSTSMTINAPAAILLAMYIAVAEKQGIASRQLRGTIQNDVLKEYTVRGTYIFPPKPSLRLVTDIFAFCKDHVPMWNTINVAGYHMREAGCSAVQEIAFSFSNAIAYIEAGLKAGLRVDDFAPRISWIFNTHNRIFEEVAKYRAARRVWADILRNRFKAENPKSWMLRFHTQTSGVSLTAQQPENNLVRVAYQALAAVLGGAQSLAACSYDEGLALPTEKSVRLSLRTQQILLHEAGVTETVDPLGGSYYVESLTRRMVREIRELIDKIDDMGGAVAAIEKGFVQREIEKRAYAHQREVEEKKRIIVGLNAYQVDEELDVSLFKPDPRHAREQVERLRTLRRERDQGKVDTVLASVRDAAVGGENLMPRFLDAVKAYATLGEICGVLREVFGEYRDAGGPGGR